jgi:phosphomevalonate kinase
VLDPIYQGFVISTPSRFYTVVREDPSIAYSETSFEILVKSPQFDDGRWRYRATRESDQTDWTVEWIQLEGRAIPRRHISESMLIVFES